MNVFTDGLELLKLVDKGLNAPLYKQLADWIDHVQNQQKTIDAQAHQIADLKEQLRFKGVVERIAGHSFEKGKDEEICPLCAVEHNKPFPLLHTSKAKESGLLALNVELVTEPPDHLFRGKRQKKKRAEMLPSETSLFADCWRRMERANAHRTAFIGSWHDIMQREILWTRNGTRRDVQQSIPLLITQLIGGCPVRRNVTVTGRSAMQRVPANSNVALFPNNATPGYRRC
jgi:hypothetical protein